MTTEVTADQIRAALRCGRRGCPCRGRTSVHCPAHDDRGPSLSVSEKAGRILVHCFTGCSQRAVIDALKERGLWATRQDDQPLPPRTHRTAPTGHARCPDCGHYLLWPDAELGDSWWCEDCVKHVLWRDARPDYYEYPLVEPQLDPTPGIMKAFPR